MVVDLQHEPTGEPKRQQERESGGNAVGEPGGQTEREPGSEPGGEP
jgi:hypothetical protein